MSLKSSPSYNNDFIPTRETVLAEIQKLDSWRHTIPIGDGLFTPGREDTLSELARLALPPDLSGKRVLDIGCSDGFYSFECEKLGAKVLSIDDFTSTPTNNGNDGFSIAKKLLNSKVAFRKMSVYELDPKDVGEFDVVLFLNVLYHLRHPLLALERIRKVTKFNGHLYLKSYFHQDIRFKRWGIDWSRGPTMKFFKGNELNNDPSNWWAPNKQCLESMLSVAGFETSECIGIRGDRIYYVCC